jgi:uncharacterized membrane protein
VVTRRIFSIRTALVVTVVGIAVGGLVGWFGFGGDHYHPATGNYGWGPIMAPVVALICGIVALLQYLALVVFRAIGRFGSERLNSTPSATDPTNEMEWNNRANWFAGLIYHSRRDTRTFVPQRLARTGFTMNVANPSGFVITVVLAAALIVTLFLSL